MFSNFDVLTNYNKRILFNLLAGLRKKYFANDVDSQAITCIDNTHTA